MKVKTKINVRSIKRRNRVTENNKNNYKTNSTGHTPHKPPLRPPQTSR